MREKYVALNAVLALNFGDLLSKFAALLLSDVFLYYFHVSAIDKNYTAAALVIGGTCKYYEILEKDKFFPEAFPDIDLPLQV